MRGWPKYTPIILAMTVVGLFVSVGQARPAQHALAKNVAPKVMFGISGDVPRSKLGSVGGPVGTQAKVDGTNMRHKR